jgi:uncharacterized protein
VRVVPRAGRTGVAGARGDALLIRVAAPPVEGAANDALLRFLANLFECPLGSVAIVGGEKSRDKRIAVVVDVATVDRKLRQLLTESK